LRLRNTNNKKYRIVLTVFFILVEEMCTDITEKCNLTYKLEESSLKINIVCYIYIVDCVLLRQMIRLIGYFNFSNVAMNEIMIKMKGLKQDLIEL
jgi:hypothetical protein